jgi:hypothetical protein
MNSPQLPKPQTQAAAQQAGGNVSIHFSMPEEDDFEPDSPESILIDKLIQGLMLGNAPMAASALRESKELDGAPLETLASFLEDSQAADYYFFPYRLEFRNRRRGKPKHQPSSGDLATPEKKLIDVLMRRDRAALAAALRNIKQLRGAARELIADLLGDPSKSSFPLRLVFRQRRRGHPCHPLTSAVRAFAWRHAFARAEAEIIRAGKKPKTEAVVADLMQKTGRCRATVFRARKKHSSADC